MTVTKETERLTEVFKQAPRGSEIPTPPDGGATGRQAPAEPTEGAAPSRLSCQCVGGPHGGFTCGPCRGDVSTPRQGEAHDAAESALTEARAEVERLNEQVMFHQSSGDYDAGYTHGSLMAKKFKDERDEAREQLRQHELANGGCVPAPAYRDLGREYARLREAVEGLADSWTEGIRIDVTMGTPRADVEPLERLIGHLRAVLADVPPAVQGDTGRGEATTGIHFESWCNDCEETIETTSEAEVDAFNAKHEHAGDTQLAEQEAGEVWRDVPADHAGYLPQTMFQRIECICGGEDGPCRCAPSGSDDTKGGAAGE